MTVVTIVDLQTGEARVLTTANPIADIVGLLNAASRPPTPRPKRQPMSYPRETQTNVRTSADQGDESTRQAARLPEQQLDALCV